MATGIPEDFVTLCDYSSNKPPVPSGLYIETSLLERKLLRKPVLRKFLKPALLNLSALRLEQSLAPGLHVHDGLIDELGRQPLRRTPQAGQVLLARLLLIHWPAQLLLPHALIDPSPDGIVQHIELRAAVRNLERDDASTLAR